MSFPFPFIGAGDAHYFEWAELHVLFGCEPSDEEKAAIEDRVPPPLEPSWEGRMLLVGSGDQFVHMHIAEHYPADEGDDDFDEGTGWFFAAPSRVRRFNEDIEAWLTAAHRHCPVLTVHRSEDAEAGGTELSDWHTWSVQRLPDLLPALEPVAASCATHPRGENSSAAYLLRGVLRAAVQTGVDVPASLRRWAS